MCIVIDANVFGSVFSSKACDHAEYKPVKDWVTEGKGFIVYGGTKYNNELRRATQYLGIFVELRKKGRVKKIADDLVDQDQAVVEASVRGTEGGTDFDDGHIVAIFRVSGCRLLCSNDARLDRYIKNRSLYLRKQRPPSIYRGKKHRRLLCDKNIVNLRHAY